MHQIEPYYGWLKFYDSSLDESSPFHGKDYNYDKYTDAIYGHYIDPAWDFIGSETLYIKILYTDYLGGYTIIEFIGEWNDAINNDIMHLKRNIIELLQFEGVDKFILIGENVMNFHGSDDCYYDEWFEEVEDSAQGPGWILAINFRPHILEEWKNYNIDAFIHWGVSFETINWRTLTPGALFERVKMLISRQIELK